MSSNNEVEDVLVGQAVAEPTPVVVEPETPEPVAESKLEDETVKVMLNDRDNVNLDMSRSPIEATEHDPESLYPPVELFGYNNSQTARIMAATGRTISTEERTAIQLVSPRRIFEERLGDTDADWQQDIKYGDDVVGAVSPRLRATGESISGLAALQMLKKQTGRGISINVPLWHSGIWITMNAPGDSALVDLDYRITYTKSNLGMETNGQLLAATSGAFSDELINSALSTVSTTNVVNLERGLTKSLLDRIDPLDYSTIIWGYLSVIYPQGYDYFIKCSAGECGHAEPIKLHFGRMCIKDASRLTPAQIKHMHTNRLGATDAQLLEYRKEFPAIKNDRIKLSNGATIMFNTTNLADYLNTSLAWRDELEAQHATALSSYSTESARDAYIDTQIQARRMQKYTHIVKSILLPDGESIIEDRETIYDALADISTTDHDIITFEAAAMKYIEAATVCIIGNPSHSCPKCGVIPETPSGPLRSFVPISVDRLFFTHVRMKIATLQELATNT